MSLAEHFAIAQRRAATVAYSLAAAATALLVTLGVVLWRSARTPDIPLDGNRSSLAEALEWPWQDFPPPVTEVERRAVYSEVKPEQPLFVSRPPLWTEMPAEDSHDPLSPKQKETRWRLRSALIDAAALPAAVGDQTDQQQRQVDDVIGALNSVMTGGEPSWLAAYDLGVLYLRRGNPQSALESFERAVDLVESNGESPPVEAKRRATLYSAAAHANYGLGLALLQTGKSEAKAKEDQRRGRAIGALRDAATAAAESIRKAGEAYPTVPRPLAFFELKSTKLSTAAIVNDLVAAYLESKDYQYCGNQRPAATACSDPDAGDDRPCGYRDRYFCASTRRAAAPFGPPFLKLSKEFYNGQRFEQEHFLWALSNAVDREAQTVTDPYLLYNFGSMLLQVGDFANAADYLDRSLDAAPQLRPEMPAEDLQRIESLAKVSAVLAGHTTGGLPNDRAQSSTIRQAYYSLYPDGPASEADAAGPSAVPTTGFTAVHTAVQPTVEALIDRWLFLQLWRKYLAEGNLARFQGEFRLAQKEPGLPNDFFDNWRDEMMRTIGLRALGRAERWEAIRELDRARLIRSFVAESGLFPGDIRERAKRPGTHALLVWRGGGVYVALLLLAVAAAYAWLYAKALVRTHRELFSSDYRRDRLAAGPAGQAVHWAPSAAAAAAAAAPPVASQSGPSPSGADSAVITATAPSSAPDAAVGGPGTIGARSGKPGDWRSGRGRQAVIGAVLVLVALVVGAVLVWGFRGEGLAPKPQPAASTGPPPPETSIEEAPSGGEPIEDLAPLLPESQPSATAAVQPAAPPDPFGSLRVAWEPWATVFLEDRPQCSTRLAPCRFAELLPRRYRVVLRNPDFGEVKQYVTIRAGVPSRLTGKFKPPAILSINATPWAFVSVNGQSQGSTPVELPLQPGPYKVELSHPGPPAAKHARTVKLKSGDNEKITYDFPQR